MMSFCATAGAAKAMAAGNATMNVQTFMTDLRP
jgi:hypothetical protein